MYQQFKLIDGILASAGESDDRESAKAILEVGVQQGTLKEVAQVIAGRYALRPEAVIEWYEEILNQRIQETTVISNKLKKLREEDDGSQ